MATVTGFTADRMLVIESQSVVDGEVDSSGDLILTTRGGDEINAGHVVGPPGPAGSLSETFSFSTAQTTWICVHNFDAVQVHVTTFDTNGDKIVGDVEVMDNNTVHVTWYFPMTGSCIVTT